MFISTDLHGHTYFSDGRASPEEYVEFRRSMGMKAIAISDHDVLAAVRAGAIAAEQARMLFIPALEVTSHLHYGQTGEEQFHILAYYTHDILEGFGLENTYFYKRGLQVQARWRDFVLNWLSKLPRDDRDALDPGSELENLSPARFPALQSMILRIVEKKRSLFEAFRDHHVLFWSSAGANRDLFGWTPEDAIAAIREDGAVDVVAHPTRYRDKARTLAVIDEARGIEVYTSRHKTEVAAAYRFMAETKQKYWTSSSDDHQNAPYSRPPCGTPLRTLERICKKPMAMLTLLAE